ncbi:MAG TPA: hypothetical protein DIS87_05970 [Armatimonadetes bacterium]|nr:hypothetical protein [Armatimonadota bacterium]
MIVRIKIKLAKLWGLLRRRSRPAETPVKGQAVTLDAQEALPSALDQSAGVNVRAQGDAGESESRRASAVPSSRARVIIGLDFGTHSTKVVLRRRGDTRARLFTPDIAIACEQYSPLVTPSLVRIDQNRLYFGTSAHRQEGGNCFRSLKVQLLTQTTELVTADEYSPDVLVCCYFSWILSQIKKELDLCYGSGNYRPLLNTAAPMAQIENQLLKERYLRIVNVAWERVFVQSNGMVEDGHECGPLMSELARALKEATVPSRDVRAFDVLPETIAPLVSLARDPRMREGKHLVMDMGAGTTEFSINNVPARKDGRPILCFHDQSVLLGNERFEAEVDPSALVDELLRIAVETWHIGFEKERHISLASKEKWKALTVVLTGGGTRRDDVRRGIQRHRERMLYPWQGAAGTSYEVITHQPTEIDADGPTGGQLQLDGFLLAVAHGLSYDRQTWPVVFNPDELAAVPELPTVTKDCDPWRDV